MKKNPLAKGESGSNPTKSVTKTSPKAKITSLAAARVKAPNSLRNNPSWKGSAK